MSMFLLKNGLMKKHPDRKSVGRGQPAPDVYLLGSGKSAYLVNEYPTAWETFAAQVLAYCGQADLRWPRDVVDCAGFAVKFRDFCKLFPKEFALGAGGDTSYTWKRHLRRFVSHADAEMGGHIWDDACVKDMTTCGPDVKDNLAPLESWTVRETRHVFSMGPFQLAAWACFCGYSGDKGMDCLMGADVGELRRARARLREQNDADRQAR